MENETAVSQGYFTLYLNRVMLPILMALFWYRNLGGVCFMAYTYNCVLITRVELGDIPGDAVQQVPQVRSSSIKKKRWSADLVFSLVSSLVCFPPLGILNLVKSRQNRDKTLSQEAFQTLSRDSRQIALISFFMGVTFIAMVIIVMLLQFLYFESHADDMELSWRRDYYLRTLNFSTGLDEHKI